MASIPNEFIDELLNRIDIYDVISPRVSLKKAGKDYSGLCPFHSENTPSFTVSQTKQFFHCFGCGQNGTAIRFIMDFEGLEFVDAIKDLAQMAGMEVPIKQSHQQKSNKNLYAITEKAARIFSHQLKSHPKVIDYLKNRDITGETAKIFQIGYALDQWDGLMKRYEFAEQAQLAETGLITNNDSGKVYDKFRNRLMFPIHDRRARVIAFGGRAIDADQKPKYLNSPETKLFHKSNELYAFHLARKHSKEDHVLVVEGYMDVVALFQHGIKNAVATLGTATSAQHIKNLFKSWNKIVFCFDGDNAGKQAAEKALMTALPLYLDNKTINFLFLPDKHDPDSYVNEYGQAAFQNLAQNAMPLSEFLIQSIAEGIDLNTLDGRAQFHHHAQTPLNQLPKGSFKKMMIQRVESITQQTIENIYQRAQKAPQPQAKTPVRKIISLLINEPQLHTLIPRDFNFSQFGDKGVEIIDKIVEICHSQPQIKSAALIETFRDEPVYQHLVPLASHFDHLDEEEKTLEFKDIINHLQQRIRTQLINGLREKQMQNGLNAEEKQQLVTLLTDKLK